MEYETIEIESNDGILWVTLNRPEKLNAVTDVLMSELNEAMSDFDGDDSLHLAILRGAGRAFCSGADVQARHLRPIEEMRRIGGPSAVGADFFAESVNFKPIIAAVHGYAVGAGYALAMRSDIVVAATGTLFQNRETQRGRSGASNWAVTQYYSGDRFANEVSLTSRMFSAEEALEHGLINFVVADDEVYKKAEAVARQIIANPPLSVRATVRPMRWYLDQRSQEVLLYVKALRLHMTDDFRESATAFLEKREPRFTGK